MSSENFRKGFSIFVMFAMSLISGAIFRISFSSVGITPPVFGSSREEIVPPVIIRTTFFSFGFFLIGSFCVFLGENFSSIFAFRIWPSLIPMLYPDSSLSKIISGL